MSVDAVWVFRRGAQVVRMWRFVGSNSQCTILIEGPGRLGAAVAFPTMGACRARQAEIERRLAARGFSLRLFEFERRHQADRRQIPRGRDRRLAASPRVDGSRSHHDSQ